MLAFVFSLIALAFQGLVFSCLCFISRHSKLW